MGFKYLLKQLQEYRTLYNDLIETLALEIISATEQHRLPRLPTFPRLRDTRSLFHDSGAPTTTATSRSPSGPKHVRFVYVAADPRAFGNARSSEAYLECGGADWKPFFPTHVARVHQFLQKVVSDDDIGFTSEELPLSPNLLAEMEEAWRRRQIVILVVDAWSLHWDATYRAILSQLDQRLDYHWCVLVPWNDQDTDSVSDRAQILATVSRTFDRHANLAPNPMFFRDAIKSAEELRTALREVLTCLKEEIKKRADIDMPIPAGPARAVITGPTRAG
jgi:FxsC-like protein